MLKKILLFLSIGLFFIGVAANNTQDNAGKPVKPFMVNQYSGKEQSSESSYKALEMVKMPVKLPHFSTVSVADDIRVIVSYGSKQSVQLIGNSSAVQEIGLEVKNRTLYIERDEYQPGYYDRSVLVKITTPSMISGLYAVDEANITARNIRSYGLTVKMEDNASIYIESRDIILRKVVNNSSKNFVMHGVNSRSLHLTGTGNGEFILSGVVNDLTAYLADAACLRAENLKAKEIYVSTKDRAIAMVSPKVALYAFAADDSNIYYTQTPLSMVRSSDESGNILKIP